MQNMQTLLTTLMFVWPCIVINFLTINHPDALISQIYFGMSRTVPLSIIRSFFYCTHSNGICHTGLLTACKLPANLYGRTLYMSQTVLLSIIRSFLLYTQQWYMSYRVADSLQAVSKPVWHIPLLCVQRKTLDDGQRNCLKHVECPSKMNLRNYCV